MEPPGAIPSIAVLRWSAEKLKPHTSDPSVQSKYVQCSQRVSDLEGKLSAGVLTKERYQQALEAMKKKVQAKPGQLAQQWMALLEAETADAEREIVLAQEAQAQAEARSRAEAQAQAVTADAGVKQHAGSSGGDSDEEFGDLVDMCN